MSDQHPSAPTEPIYGLDDRLHPVDTIAPTMRDQYVRDRELADAVTFSTMLLQMIDSHRKSAARAASQRKRKPPP